MLFVSGHFLTPDVNFDKNYNNLLPFANDIKVQKKHGLAVFKNPLITRKHKQNTALDNHNLCPHWKLLLSIPSKSSSMIAVVILVFSMDQKYILLQCIYLWSYSYTLISVDRVNSG